MVREFLQGERGRGPMVPQSFNMSSLLTEIPTVPQTQQSHPHQGLVTHVLCAFIFLLHHFSLEVAVNSWVEEFGRTQKQTGV